MQFIRGLHNLRPGHRGGVVTIGNFDGVHLGHQALLRQLLDAAAHHALPAVVVIFEPQPREYFQGAGAPARLNRFREKLELLREAGIARVLCLRFDEKMAGCEPEAFVEQVLVQGLAARVVIIGDDFCFGRARRGNFALLTQLGREHGFATERADTFRLDAERVGSSRVRTALEQGDLETARRLLGRHYKMSGRVAHGEKRGRQIGFPTININLHRRHTPVRGIFAARVHGLGSGAPLDGMAYIGDRPVVSGTKVLLEVHLFDFTGECYGRHVHVEFIRKLREDAFFSSLEALREQMHADADQARRLLRAAS
ncbi:MAG: bifunctional riboflavin kinase/FAD synthetase [Chromatiales bacterium]